MAKFVVAGKSDCPFYARAELLADELAIKLPHFSVHKIVLDPTEWDEWLSNLCENNGWRHTGSSPIIWRELRNRGGKGLLLGSCNDFLEYTKGYYGITSSKSSDELKSIGIENRETKCAIDEKERSHLATIKPFKIVVTNADSDLSYHILPSLCSTSIMKGFEEISFSLHYNNSDEKQMEVEHTMNGVVMELQDCAEKQLKKVNVTNDMIECFEEANLIVLLNLTENFDIKLVSELKEIALCLNKTIKDSTKILIVGENAILCCNVIAQYGSEIPKQNLMAMTRFEENKVKSAVAKLLEVNSAGIDNLIIWGSSKEYVVDYDSSSVCGYNGAVWAPHISKFSHSIKEVVYDKKFLDKELPQYIGNQNVKVADKVLSYSAAFTSQLKDLMSNNVDRNGIFSLGLVSEGWYDVPEGLVYSFPVKYTKNGMIVVSDLELSQRIKDDIKRTSLELDAYLKETLQINCFDDDATNNQESNILR